MIELTQQQRSELQYFLGHDPADDGEWAVIPEDVSCTHVINSKGNMIIRLPSRDERGYLQTARKVTLRLDPGGYAVCSVNNRQYKMHRLMASIWLADFDDSLTVNHKDGNKQNNDYHNLEMMTSKDNVSHYHHSDALKEKREADFKYHGTTIRGRIHITNGIEAKMIYESDGIPEGWWKGRPQSMKDKESASMLGKTAFNLGKRMITDGVHNKFISDSEEIPDGWRLGGVSPSDETKQRMSEGMIGRIYIHKGTLNKRIYESELTTYLDQGWEKGMYAEHLDASSLKSVKFKEEMRERMKGERNPMYGKHLSEEHKARLLKANLGRRHTEEAKKKMSETKLNKHMHHTEEAKKKMSDAMKGRTPGNKGTIWITNGTDNKMILESELSAYPGYYRGITRTPSTIHKKLFSVD